VELKVLDGHNDVLLAVVGEREASRSFFKRGDRGHLDLPRAREGSFAGGFFAVFSPPKSTSGPVRRPPEALPGCEPLAAAIESSHALGVTMALTAVLFRIEAESKGELRVVRDVADLRNCMAEDVVAAILHFEGAEAIDPQLNALEVFYQAGLRSLGLVWSRPNLFAEGVPFGFPASPDTGSGLTIVGRELVRACNELGVMLDLSHLNERGFWDVSRLSQAPLVATHSNAHALCASTRNLTDRQLDAIRDSGGVVGVNFSVAFSREDGRKVPDTPLEDIVRHFVYLVKRMGVDHVCFGSDFDGTTVPNELGDVAGLPKLLDALRSVGFQEPELRKLAHENWLRVLGQTWRPVSASR
jgi:membrane dipeptidase